MREIKTKEFIFSGIRCYFASVNEVDWQELLGKKLIRSKKGYIQVFESFTKEHIVCLNIFDIS